MPRYTSAADIVPPPASSFLAPLPNAVTSAADLRRYSRILSEWFGIPESDFNTPPSETGVPMSQFKAANYAGYAMGVLESEREQEIVELFTRVLNNAALAPRDGAKEIKLAIGAHNSAYAFPFRGHRGSSATNSPRMITPVTAPAQPLDLNIVAERLQAQTDVTRGAQLETSLASSPSAPAGSSSGGTTGAGKRKRSPEGDVTAAVSSSPSSPPSVPSSPSSPPAVPISTSRKLRAGVTATLREQLLQREEGGCLFCWKKQNLQVCHILSLKTGCTTAAERERILRLCGLTDLNEMANLVMLCGDCHNQFDKSLIWVRETDGVEYLNSRVYGKATYRYVVSWLRAAHWRDVAGAIKRDVRTLRIVYGPLARTANFPGPSSKAFERHYLASYVWMRANADVDIDEFSDTESSTSGNGAQWPLPSGGEFESAAWEEELPPAEGKVQAATAEAIVEGDIAGAHVSTAGKR